MFWELKCSDFAWVGLSQTQLQGKVCKVNFRTSTRAHTKRSTHAYNWVLDQETLHYLIYPSYLPTAHGTYTEA